MGLIKKNKKKRPLEENYLKQNFEQKKKERRTCIKYNMNHLIISLQHLQSIDFNEAKSDLCWLNASLHGLSENPSPPPRAREKK